jgi:hypothetical protein
MRDRFRRFIGTYHLRAIASLVGLLIVGYFIEPFSARYQGRTVRQWINHNADYGVIPDRDMVRYFGASAVPQLLFDSRPGGLTSAAIALESVFKSERFDSLRSADFNRRIACADWAKMLLQVDQAVFTRLLENTRDDEQAIELTRLFYGDRYLGQTLKILSRQQTNMAVQARAGHLLKVYRDTI